MYKKNSKSKNLSKNCSRPPFLADIKHTEVAYLSIHAFGRGDIHIENTSCHVFIDNVTPKDSYFVV